MKTPPPVRTRKPDQKHVSEETQFWFESARHFFDQDLHYDAFRSMEQAFLEAEYIAGFRTTEVLAEWCINDQLRKKVRAFARSIFGEDELPEESAASAEKTQ